MEFSVAVKKRTSIRAFTNAPVSNAQITTLLDTAAQAPSGGNVQPWRVFVLNDAVMERFKQTVQDNAGQEQPSYAIYPEHLKDPYRTARFEVGEMMYALLDIPRDDRAGRFARLAENYQFFGAPAAIFCFVDRQMGPPQWSDLGMFLQTFMLAATDAGLATCAQEAWAMKPETVAQFVGAPEGLMLFCGVAIGHADANAPVNALISKRFSVTEFTTFVS